LVERLAYNEDVGGSSPLLLIINFNNKMYLVLVFLPLIGSITAGLFGRKLGPKGSSIVTVTLLFITFLLSVFAFYEVALIGSPVYIKLITWINSEVLNVDWGFYLTL
jgi:NADH-ubiquinone oxidoreductase chain 5